MKYITKEQEKEFNKKSDEKNPTFLFSCTDTEILTMIANNEIDPRAFAWKELANRGMDNNGIFVGFNKAKQIFESNINKNS